MTVTAPPTGPSRAAATGSPPLGAGVVGTALWRRRRALVGWSLGITLLVVLESSLWPSMREMTGLQAMLESYPDALARLFDLSAFSTGRGFLNVELFSLVLPLLFITFGIGAGARAIASDEEAGILGVLLLTPLTPVGLLLRHAVALLVQLVGLGVLLTLVVTGLSPVFQLGIGIGDAAAGALAMTLLGLAFGALALAVGAATGRHAVAIGVASVAAVGSYLLYAIAQIDDAVRPWQVLSLFHHALIDGPMGAGLHAGHAWLAVVAVASIAAAAPLFDRRDIAAH